MVFYTERLIIRKLKKTDIESFHKMQANPNVMKYTDSPKVKTYDEDVEDLQNLINLYSKKENNFWVWAVERKKDNAILGTIALIPYDKNNDEVGFRFIEEYWNNGYGFEALQGLLIYAKKIGYKKLVAEVYAKNIGSEIILRKAGFTFIKEYLCKETKLMDRLFKLEL